MKRPSGSSGDFINVVKERQTLKEKMIVSVEAEAKSLPLAYKGLEKDVLSLAGKVPDWVLAERCSVGVSTIRRARIKARIAPCRRHFRGGHRRKISRHDMYSILLPSFGKVSDIHLSRLFGVSRERIRQIRKKHHFLSN